MRQIQNLFILLILFIFSFFILYYGYLFRVLFLVLIIFLLILFYSANIFFLKYLVILVYVRGIVVFILYISCICWYTLNKYRFLFLVFRFLTYVVFDLGAYSKFSDVSDSLWIYLYFRFLFNSLVIVYSLNLFKISGSLRFQV